MKTLLSKVISYLCVMCLLFSVSVSSVSADSSGQSTEQFLSDKAVIEAVCAISEENNSIDEQYAEEVSLFLCDTMDNISSVDEDKDGKPKLEASFGEVEGSITIEQANSSGTVLQIEENEKHNVIEFSDTGEVFVNGERVQFEYEDGEASLDKSIRNTTTCPYGKAADYSKVTVSGKKMGYVNLTSGAVTLGAIAVGIILAAFSPPLFASIAGTIIVGVISYWASEKLNPKYISVKKWEYVHKSKGWQVTSHKAVEKRKIKLYPSKNYSGKSKYTKVSYRVYSW